MTDREVMQMALVQMGINQYTVAELAPHKVVMAFNSAMETLRAQLEQPEHEPVAWMHKKEGLLRRETSRPKSADWDADHWIPLYTTSTAAQREWSSLTNDEIKEIIGPWGEAQIHGYTRWLFDKIDEALRRKNT
jgi:hypothetical protein